MASGQIEKEEGALAASIDKTSSQPKIQLANGSSDSQNTKSSQMQRTRTDATSMQKESKPGTTTQSASATVQGEEKGTQQKKRNILKVLFHRH